MSVKPCNKCGSTTRYANGKCKTCADSRVRAYRAKASGKDTENNPVNRQARPDPVSSGPDTQIDLTTSLSSGPKRLEFMIERHERTLRSIDEEEKYLALRLKESEEANRTTDIRFYVQERRKLLEMRVSYDARLAKDLQAYQELIAKEDTETPVTFMQVGMPPREWVTAPAVGDNLDLSAFMPGKGPEKPAL